MLNSPNLSIEDLEAKIRGVVLKTVSERARKNPHQKDRLDSSLATDNLPVGVKFSPEHSRKFKNLLSLLIVYHYYPLERSVLCYLRIDLEDIISEIDKSYWLVALLENQERFLKYLLAQQTMTLQEFSSGVNNVTSISRAIDSCVLRFEQKLRTPRRIVRRKGYRDKGSLGDISSSVLKAELKDDFYLTLLQYQIEEKKLLKHWATQSLISYLDGTKELSDELLVEFRIRKGDNTNVKSDYYTQVKDYIEQREDYYSRTEEKQH